MPRLRTRPLSVTVGDGAAAKQAPVSAAASASAGQRRQREAAAWDVDARMCHTKEQADAALRALLRGPLLHCAAPCPDGQRVCQLVPEQQAAVTRLRKLCDMFLGDEETAGPIADNVPQLMRSAQMLRVPLAGARASLHSPRQRPSSVP